MLGSTSQCINCWLLHLVQSIPISHLSFISHSNFNRSFGQNCFAPCFQAQSKREPSPRSRSITTGGRQSPRPLRRIHLPQNVTSRFDLGWKSIVCTLFPHVDHRVLEQCHLSVLVLDTWQGCLRREADPYPTVCARGYSLMCRTIRPSEERCQKCIKTKRSEMSLPRSGVWVF